MARLFSSARRTRARASAVAMIVAGTAVALVGAVGAAGPASAVPGPCSSFTTPYYCTAIISGNGQTTNVGTPFAQALEVQVGLDGGPANNETVVFHIAPTSVAAHFGASSSSTTATSSSSGYATTTVALTPTAPGTVIVDASWYDGDTF